MRVLRLEGTGSSERKNVVRLGPTHRGVAVTALYVVRHKFHVPGRISECCGGDCCARDGGGSFFFIFFAASVVVAADRQTIPSVWWCVE